MWFVWEDEPSTEELDETLKETVVCVFYISVRGFSHLQTLCIAQKLPDSRGRGIYVYIALTHVAEQQKLTQHCKTITLQLKNLKMPEQQC